MTTQQAPRPAVDAGPNRYVRLAAMGVLSLGATYLVLFSRVDMIDDVVLGLDQLYLAGLVTTVLGVLELIVMRDTYPNPRANAALLAGLGFAALVFFGLIRREAGVSDEQLVRAMIPHHAAAIHMCQSADLEDPALTRMCSEMISTQRREIEQMKAKLRAANE